MQKKTAFIIAVGIAISLTGCVSTPENLKEQKNSSQQAEKKDGIQLDSLKNVLDCAKDIQGQTYENLYFADNFQVNQPEQIGKIEFSQRKDFDKDGMQILKEFVKEIDPKIKVDTNLVKPGLQYIDEKGQESFSLGNDGFLYYAYEEGDSWISVKNGDTEEYELVEQVCVEYEYDNKSFQWKDKEVSLTDIVETAQKSADEFTKKYDSMSWRPSILLVYENKQGEYYFEVRFTKSYQGADLFYEDYRKALDYVKAPYVSVMQPYMVFNSSKEMLAVDNYPGILDYNKTIEEYDNIITLQCASELLSDKLSSYKAYNVYHVNLEYRLVQTDGEKVEKDGYYCNWRAGNIYETSPCWTFYLSNDMDRMTFAMVDCVTGEVEFVSGE
ncbi:hypothetical protein [[Clostridium] polysaccharolyticum]|uniref:Lipoprotein n=1 Tax=[Clostridium] polysaccharolyticum TaxID=29364 RepID=A0A1I0BBC4_9FIRM|nr:hypothetical protein [[Clostridium] polysaccharolyticum]SET04113.1 hypothetical protein SAMN04487772_10754 [[Clostridium] polysaccharolyticum]